MTSLARDHDTTPATRRRLELTADAVVVEYIHAISERHRLGDAAVEPSCGEGKVGRR